MSYLDKVCQHVFCESLPNICFVQKLVLRTWSLIFNLQVDQYIHRILVEEDANTSEGSNSEIFEASADAGIKLYKKGDFARSQYSSLDVYLLRKVPKIHLRNSNIIQQA